MGLENWSWLTSGEYSHWGLYFLKKKYSLKYFLKYLGSCPHMWYAGNHGCGHYKVLGWDLAVVASWDGGEEGELRQGGSWDILFKTTQHLESLVSHHHLYSWGLDTSLHSAAVFVTFGFTMFKLKSLAPCSLSTASLSIYFCLPHPVWISFVNLYLTTLRDSVAGFGFTIYLACSVTLAETTNLIHDVNSKL